LDKNRVELDTSFPNETIHGTAMRQEFLVAIHGVCLDVMRSFRTVSVKMRIVSLLTYVIQYPEKAKKHEPSGREAYLFWFASTSQNQNQVRSVKQNPPPFDVVETTKATNNKSNHKHLASHYFHPTRNILSLASLAKTLITSYI